METKISRKILAISIVMLLFIFQAGAQNKEIDKGKESLNKALEQKDMSKRNDMINKAKEELAKGGMKAPEIAMLVGDAYLDKGDLKNAANSYGAASKEDKKAGFKKVADAFVDGAFSGDAKTEAKAIKDAMSYYGKAGADALKEGALNIGDKYYAKGPDSYNRALDFYMTAGAMDKVDGIAKELFDKGGDNEDKAAEIYLRLKTPAGYEKAGDIYFNKKEYQKAIDAYQAGNVAEGIRKYADYLYAQNRNEEADNFYVKLGEILGTEKDDAALEKLANECMSKGSYNLAARIYDKAGNSSLSSKCMGYAELIAFNLDSAKMFFGEINDAAMVKKIADNEKVLSPLKDVAENFDEIMRGVPAMNMITDSVTGQAMLSASDQKTLEDYYKSVRDQIIKNVFDVSAKMAKLTDPELRKFARMRFMHYGAIRQILDTESFAIKKQKQDIKVKDVVL
jgi:hypothetical protein